MRSTPLSIARSVRVFALAAAVGAAVGLGIERLTSSRPDGAVSWGVALIAALATAGVCAVGTLARRGSVRREQDAAEHEAVKYRALWAGSADMVFVVDALTLSVAEQSTRAREECGDVTDLTRILSDDDTRSLRDAALRATRAVRGESGIPSLRIRSASGRELDCEARLAVIALAGRTVVHVALRDRTHERAAEHEIAVRERLSSLGLLTAGVAHEINNPLEGIANHVKLLGRPDITPEDRARHLGLVRHGFERIRDLVRDLLRFSRPTGTRGDVDLVQVIDRARRMALYTDSFREIEFTTAGLDRPLVVLGDSGRLEQVALNLFLNAAKAMKGRGRIVVSAERWSSDSKHVTLTIADDGPGVAPEHLERIFDPFFTTGGGTGLGLSIAYGILQAHGGTLAVRNRPEGGAEFTLRFPQRVAQRSGEAA